MAFAPDSKALAPGGQDGAVVLWDVAAGGARAVLKGHGGPVTGVAFAPGGKALAAAGGKEVQVWALSTGD
jgi:WD40 repeat protein